MSFEDLPINYKYDLKKNTVSKILYLQILYPPPRYPQYILYLKYFNAKQYLSPLI